MYLQRSQILDKLLLLIFTFISGSIALVLVHIFFMNLEKELDHKTENQKAKITIGEFISEDLHIIRSDFYELATAVTNSRGRKIIIDKIDTKIRNIQDMLNVLQNGGTLTRVIRLNIAGHNTTTKTVKYKSPNKGEIPLEAIDLRPKLEEIKMMVQEVQKLLVLSEKLMKEDPFAYAKNVKKLNDIINLHRHFSQE